VRSSITNKKAHLGGWLIAGGVVAGLALAACGSDDTSDSTQSPTTPAAAATTAVGGGAVTTAAAGSTPGAAAQDGVFPVTIKHKFGESTVPKEPTRVITVGFNEQDEVLALGVQPLAIRDWYGDQPYAVWPWAVAALGDAKPTVLPSDALNFEQIASLQPDLILGVSSGMTQDDYDKLSKIAPTIAQSGDVVDYGESWQDATLTIGQALGKAKTAQDLVADTEAKIAATAAAHPEFAGKSTAVAFFFNDLPGAYSSVDVRSRLMTGLGFVIPEAIDQAAGDAFYASFSAEQIDLLDVDALVWIADIGEQGAIVASPLRNGLNAVKEGREVWVSDILAGAMSFSSPLSIPYVLEHLPAELQAAVDGDPSTPVPSAQAIGTASSVPATTTG